MSTPVRVRFAPSPTGYLHIGGARTALFNYLYARRHNGTFILRIEDTDKERSTYEAQTAILRSMNWLGLHPDEGPEGGGECGPYIQSQRTEHYAAAVGSLLRDNKAYCCFCTPEQLEADKAAARKKKQYYKYPGTCRHLTEDEVHKRLEAKRPYCIRLKTKTADVAFTDIIHGEKVFPAESVQVQDFIITRTGGMPVYNLTCVVDDAAMGITHVIRGDDHLNNTPRQILLYTALGLTPPQFAHVPMILGPDGARLSKRHGATSVEQYITDGYLPEAMINFLVRLGWGFDDKTELFSMGDLIEKFSLEKVSKNPALFDIQKLNWLNAHYIQQYSPKERIELIMPVLREQGLISDGKLSQEDMIWIEGIIRAIGERLKNPHDIIRYADYFFIETIEYEPKAWEKGIVKVSAQDFLPEVIPLLEAPKEYCAEALEIQFKTYIDKTGIKPRALMQAVRVALTGKLVSPGIFDVMELLGKERCIKRIQSVIDTD